MSAIGPSPIGEFPDVTAHSGGPQFSKAMVTRVCGGSSCPRLVALWIGTLTDSSLFYDYFGVNDFETARAPARPIRR